MKKILNLPILFIFISTLNWECQKNQNTPSQGNFVYQQELINNAKTYFEDSVQATNQGISLNDFTNIDSENFDAIKLLKKDVLWNHAYTVKISIGDVVVVPLQFKDSLYAKPENADSSANLPIDKLSKLIVYSDATKNLHAQVVSFFPDENFIKNPKSYFSGVAFIQDWQGDYLKSYSYKDGQIKPLSFNNKSNNNTETTNSLITPDITTLEVCYEEVYDVSINGEYSYTYVKELGCVDISGGASGVPSGSGPSGADYATISKASANGTTVQVSSVSSIFSITRDLVTNPCLKAVVEKL